MNNSQVSEVFEKIAGLLAFKGGSEFTIRAYQRTSRTIEHLDFMRLGVAVARRGWCQAADILNTRPVDEFFPFPRGKA